ncbi:class I SAM-dependent methyltransferase [Streptomyces sp. NPDC001770]
MSAHEEHQHGHGEHEGHGHGHRHGGGHGHRHGHGHGAQDAGDFSVLTEMLDLDAEVLHEHLDELTGWIQELSGGTAGGAEAAERAPGAADAAEAPQEPGGRRPRVLDLGSGTGAGTFALLQRFPDAEVTAVDASPEMAARLAEKAAARGVADRVRTVVADLDTEALPAGPYDLVWASASLHHMADPGRVLAQVREVLRPGGLMVAVELEGFPRFLPDDLGIGRPGLEERVHAAQAEGRTAAGMHMAEDWGARLREAGLDVVAERVVAIDLTAPLPAATGRYVQASLTRVRSALDGVLDAEDLATLDALTEADGPHGVLHRDDLTVRTERSVWVAGRG